MNLETLTVPLKLDKSGFNPAVAAVAAGVAAVVAGVTLAVNATAKWATELDSLGDVMDGTNKDFAALAFVARKSGVGVDTLVKANVLLNKGLLKTNGTLDLTGKKLKEYGINVKDANGNVKNSIQLTDEIAQKYAALGTAQERVNFLTEIYGKSGAQLVDFFDTLNSEGGISAVTKKVEALGLAIDPSRYEKFNRNLEELKMVGLGVAVAFTEKLMPVLEKFLDWAIKVSPEVKNFFDTMMLAFERGGLGNMLGVLDRWVANQIDDIDWGAHGARFGEMIENMLSTGIGEVNLPQFAVSLGNGIKEFLIAAVGEENVSVFKEHFVDYIILQLNYLDVTMNNLVRSAFAKMGETIKGKLQEIDTSFANWSIRTGQTIDTWANNTILSAIDTMVELSTTFENKLREIGKVFFSRALGWTQQAKAGFLSGLNNILSVVEMIVDEVNGILRKIKTHFNITFGFGGQSGGSNNSNTGNNPPVGEGSDERQIKPGRATGGAVIAGHAYSVVELNRPEVFRPHTSGRIDPVSDKPVIARIPRQDMREFADIITETILRGAA